MNDYIEKLKIKYENLNYYDKNLLSEDNTVLIIMDMTNGFVNKGNLSSNRIKNIVNPIRSYIDMCKNYQKIYFLDGHSDDSEEFNYFPVHGIGDEGNLIDEFDKLIDKKSKKIYKNSTNAFFAPAFGEWLKDNFKNMKNYIIVGDCTDLCVLQFALSVKAFYNQWNISSEIIVPTNAVDTFDLKETLHSAEVMNLFAFYNMDLNGIKIVKGISD